MSGEDQVVVDHVLTASDAERIRAHGGNSKAGEVLKATVCHDGKKRVTVQMADGQPGCVEVG